MKQSTKRILGYGIFLVMLAALLLGMRVYRMLSDMKQMTPLDSGEIVSGIYAIRDSYVNLYLLKGREGYVAIDSGIEAQVVREELKKLNIEPALVAAIFLTHSDTDHTGGLAVFSNARIYLSNDEEQMVDGNTALRLARYFGTDARSWMNLQAAYDLRVAELAQAKRIAATIRPRAA